jgi:formylglycine-generating enzyme required for sulfatase activity
MKTMRYAIAILACGLTTGAYGTLPVVTNVVAVQRTDTKLVDINYSVFDDDGDLLRIRVEVSDNAGNTYSVPAFSMTGDIGDNVVTGANKHIVWDAGKDWDGEYSDLMRVKVIAVDAVGLPGLAWGSEVATGGFLMGQDGGAEGSGPSRHVNIPWSYWLSKYEIRNDQFCDFLNIALVAGDVYRVGTTEVRAEIGRFPGVPGGARLIYLGDTKDIRWSVNNFEVSGVFSNHPVRVTWYGAMAFAKHYGYDLPTDAEWEKAARGPENENQDTHRTYPWGNTISGGNANYSSSGDPYGSKGTTPVGYYNGNQTPLGPNMANAYGLYDIIGNVYEWQRSTYVTTESYPQQESMAEAHNQIRTIANRIYRGGSYNISSSSEELKTYYRQYTSSLTDDSDKGFRVARRTSDYVDPTPTLAISENFDGAEWTARGSTSSGWTFAVTSGTWTASSRVYVEVNEENAYRGSGYIRMGDYGYYSTLSFSLSEAMAVGLVVWARSASSDNDGNLYFQEYDGTTWRNMEGLTISGTDYRKVRLNTVLANSQSGQQFRLQATHSVFIDDIQIYTVPQP